MKSLIGGRAGAAFLAGALAALAGPVLGGQASPANVPGDRFGRVYPARIYQAEHLQGLAPSIDGRLDDAAWQQGEWSGGYTQQIPTEGATPTSPTELKILYDEDNVYVAIRAYDDPAKMHRYAGRRDDIVGDVVGVCFDSYFDKRTGFEFDLTAGGNKIDLVLTNDGWDTSWDAVWYGKVGMEENAWTAELRIPLSQLRYGPQDEQVWGLHAWRWIDRNQEEDQWQLIPRNSTGRMYNLGELHGIHGVARHRRIELLPYSLGRITAEPREAGNPYRIGPAGSAALGLDGKVGITSDFTLDATINPDFGQVEADPSVMNLTAYETFYEEKRPFFLEGKTIMSFDLSGWGDRLFYSRRIGHAPSRSPDLRDGESIDTPESSTILSALKVTGKSRGGLSLGILQSLTAPEEARLSYQGQERREPVEPFGSYTVVRMHKDWDKGNTSVGGILTNVRRSIHEEALDLLPSSAVTGGLEVKRYFSNRTYSIEANAAFSRIGGSSQAITDLQSNPVHYFQRPDASHLTVDEAATALGGHGGVLRVRRHGTSRLNVADTFRWRSPGLDLNDVGYQWQADLLNHDFEIEFHEPKPRGPLREYGLYFERWDMWDFGGLHTESQTAFTGWGTFSNKWTVEGGVRRLGAPVSTRLLRGGPAVRLLPFICSNLNGHTDPSRRVSFDLNTHAHFFGQDGFGRYDLSPKVSLRLSRRVAFSLNLDYTRNRDGLEYVATPDGTPEPRYILGHIDQKTVGATVRLSLHLTPDLSIQFYGSPFVSSGRYSDLKRVTDPRAAAYEDRFVVLADEGLSFDAGSNTYQVTEQEGTSYSFDNPDFSFRQFRANLVARWEYRPGSALYVVWSQGRTDSVSDWDGSVERNLDALWSTPPTNVFLIKLAHWFAL